MSQGNDFANYSAASNAGTGGSDEVWFVAVASDDIKQMTIDQLDEAFRLGVITGETPVWTEGMEAWSPLAKVADLDGDSGSEARDAGHASSVHATSAPGHSGTYGAASNTGSYGAASNAYGAASNTGSYGAASNGGAYGAGSNGGAYGAASNTGAYGAASNTGAYGAAGAAFGAVTLQSVQHSFAPGPSSVAPVTASYAPGPHAGHSPLPVAINGDEEVAPLPRRGRGPARWLLAGAAAAIAIGVVAYNNLSSSVASAGTAAAAPAALAARPYDSAEGAGTASAGSARGDTSAGSARADGEAAAAPSRGAESDAIGAAVVASSAAAASTTAKAALLADEGADEPASKKGAEKDSLKNSFSKSLTKKGTSSKSAKVKPRRAASRASTKSRAPKAKKSTVVRTQSAFDPLNDSLP